MFAQTLSLAALVAFANAHGVIIGAQGEAGSPPSVGFQVNEAIARNCTTINPCQMDTTIIRDAEIKAGTVNSCGRTKLSGNIDVGENTENALAADAVTKVKSGSQIQVTIHQVNADGAGPYFCDLDETSNTGVFTHNLTVTNNIPGSNGLSQAQAQDFNITVAMPDNFKCVGGSTGNVCTVRCRNNAVAGPFGGCFAVQQTDADPVSGDNNPANIATADKLSTIDSEVASNQAALPAAVEANQNAGSSQAEQNLAAVKAILGLTTTKLADFPTQTPTLVNNGGAATATPTSVVGGGNGNGNGNGNNNNNGNGNGRGRFRNGNGNNGNANANTGTGTGTGAGNNAGNGNNRGNGNGGNGNGSFN